MPCWGRKKQVAPPRLPTVSPRQHYNLSEETAYRLDSERANEEGSLDDSSGSQGSTGSSLLLLGLEGCGKTTIDLFLESRQFELCGPTPVYRPGTDLAFPTISQLTHQTEVDSYKMKVVDPSGKLEARKGLWPGLIRHPRVRGLVFIVDLTSRIMHPLAKKEIRNMLNALSHKGRTRPSVPPLVPIDTPHNNMDTPSIPLKPILFVGNTMDNSNYDRDDMLRFMEDLLDDHVLPPNLQYRVITTCSRDRHSLLEGLSWLWTGRAFKHAENELSHPSTQPTPRQPRTPGTHLDYDADDAVVWQPHAGPVAGSSSSSMRNGVQLQEGGHVGNGGQVKVYRFHNRVAPVG